MIKKYKLVKDEEEFIYNNFWQLRNKLQELLPNTSLPSSEENLFKQENVDFFKDNFNIEISTYEEEEPVPTLEEAKKSKISELTNDKYQEIKAGMLWKEEDGVKYIADTDESAKTAIIGQVTAFDKGLMETVSWKFQNYLWLDFTKEEFTVFAGTILNWIESKFTKEKNLIEQVNNCTTVEEVEAISWNSEETE